MRRAEPPSPRSSEPSAKPRRRYGARDEVTRRPRALGLRDLLKPVITPPPLRNPTFYLGSDASVYTNTSSWPCTPRSLVRPSEDEENQLTSTKTRRAAAPRRVLPPAHSLSMEEEPDVSFSRAEEDEEQNPATTEKLAVSLLLYLPYMRSYHVADQLLQK